MLQGDEFILWLEVRETFPLHVVCYKEIPMKIGNQIMDTYNLTNSLGHTELFYHESTLNKTVRSFITVTGAFNKPDYLEYNFSNSNNSQFLRINKDISGVKIFHGYKMKDMDIEVYKTSEPL